jgi:hypothetical protein
MGMALSYPSLSREYDDDGSAEEADRSRAVYAFSRMHVENCMLIHSLHAWNC